MIIRIKKGWRSLATRWWRWYAWHNHFWCITANMRQNSAIHSLLVCLVSPILYILLSNLICLLSNSSNRYAAGLILSHLTSFVYYLLPTTQTLDAYCLPSALVWLYRLRNRAHHHHMTTAVATVPFHITFLRKTSVAVMMSQIFLLC